MFSFFFKKEIASWEGACAEQELKLQESDIPGAELPKASEYWTMASLKRWLACQGAKLSGKRKDLIKRSVRLLGLLMSSCSQ